MEERKSRVDSAVPHPEGAEKLSEKEKQQLEQSGEIEHQHGQRREQTAKEAEKLEKDQ